MKFMDLINYIKDPDKLKRLIHDEGLNTDSEALLVYMKDSLDIDSEIKIFEIEETKDDLVYKKDEIHYIQLFPLYMTVEFVEEFMEKNADTLKIAQRLLEYRINDA